MLEYFKKNKKIFILIFVFLFFVSILIIGYRIYSKKIKNIKDGTEDKTGITGDEANNTGNENTGESTGNENTGESSGNENTGESSGNENTCSSYQELIEGECLTKCPIGQVRYGKTCGSATPDVTSRSICKVGDEFHEGLCYVPPGPPWEYLRPWTYTSCPGTIKDSECIVARQIQPAGKYEKEVLSYYPKCTPDREEIKGRCYLTASTGNENTGDIEGKNTAEQMSIETQNDNSIQIVNNTSENPLHVFFQLNNIQQRWEKIGGSSNTTSHPPVNWGTTFYNNQNNPYEHSWAPLGAKIASEIIIPLNGFIILKFPDLDPPQFVSMAIKMKNQNDYYPLTLDDGSPLNREGGSIRKIKEQSAPAETFIRMPSGEVGDTGRV